MICHSVNCTAQGLFNKTDGYCPRCYAEIHEIKEPGHIRFVIMAWVALLLFVGIIGRAGYLMFFD